MSGDIIRQTIQNDINSRKNGYVPPKTPQPQWLYPSAIERDYAKYIRILMKSFVYPISNSLKEQLPEWVRDKNSRVDSYVDDMKEFNSKATEHQNEVFDEDDITDDIFTYGIAINAFNKKEWVKQVNWVLKSFKMTPEMLDEPDIDALVELWATNNYKLIKSLSDEYIKKVNQIVTDGLLKNEKAPKMIEEITSLNSTMTKARANLIARDQVGKLNGILTKGRQEDVGANLYEWLTSKDERVRSKHKTLHGKICKWDNPNVYSDDGKNFKNRTSDMFKGIPGEDYQCRCNGVIFWDAIIEELAA